MVTGPQSGPVGIVGLGLIGGSLAKALQAAGVPVVATDPASNEEARAAGLSVVDDVAGLALHRPEIVVLAAPLRAMRAVAGFLRSQRIPLSAFYASNVEFYLWRNGGYAEFLANLVVFPRADHAVVIRSTFDRDGSVSDVAAISTLIANASQPLTR